MPKEPRVLGLQWMKQLHLTRLPSQQNKSQSREKDGEKVSTSNPDIFTRAGSPRSSTTQILTTSSLPHSTVSSIFTTSTSFSGRTNRLIFTRKVSTALSIASSTNLSLPAVKSVTLSCGILLLWDH